MNAMEALVAAIDKVLVTRMVAYDRQATVCLLANKVDDAKALAHKADALREASQMLLATAQKFKDPEEE